MTTYVITRHDLLDLLTIAAQIGHEMDYLGCTRGDITARIERDMAVQLAKLDERTSPAPEVCGKCGRMPSACADAGDCVSFVFRDDSLA